MTEKLANFVHESWSSRLGFMMATIGTAVGLGNLWRFPYITGVNGGGAFVLVYIICILALGIPLMMSELMLGRRGGQSGINTMRKLARDENASPFWQVIGWLMVLIPLFGITYYSVVAGWGLAYVFESATGSFNGLDGNASSNMFDSLTADPLRMASWHAVFMGITIFIVSRGVNKGIERAAKIMIPSLFILLVIMVGYALVAADFRAGFNFLFNFDLSKVTGEVVLMAMGQAFFSLAISVGVMMTYGAYLSKDVSIGNSVCIIAFADTLVAILAGLAIFPIVFAAGLEPGEGPGLIFVTMPVAFGQMPAGALFGTLFFILLCFAAITTGIGMLEPAVSFLEEKQGLKRPGITIMLGAICWAAGLASVFSFNIWQDFRPAGFIEKFSDKTIFDMLDFSIAHIFVPLGGLLIALFTGWVMRRSSTLDELGMEDGFIYKLWRFLVRYIAPVAVLSIVYAYI